MPHGDGGMYKYMMPYARFLSVLDGLKACLFLKKVLIAFVLTALHCYMDAEKRISI